MTGFRFEAGLFLPRVVLSGWSALNAATVIRKIWLLFEENCHLL